MIELLVVIAIIAILAAILFPVYARIKEKGRQTVCLAQLKQLGIAFQAYANDNDGHLPRLGYGEAGSYDNWAGCGQDCIQDLQIRIGSLHPYVKSEAIYFCPTDAGRKVGPQGNGPILMLSYSMNYYMDKARIDQVRNPSDMLLLIHEGRDTINDGSFCWNFNYDIPDMGHNGVPMPSCSMGMGNGGRTQRCTVRLSREHQPGSITATASRALSVDLDGA